MTPELREARVRRLYDEVWSRGDLALADDLFTPDYRSAAPDSPPGPEGEKRHIAMIRSAFPDLQVTVEQVVAAGDQVAARWTMAGTNTGSIFGHAPTGQLASFWGVHFFRFSGDRISACWTGVDMLGLLVQLGIAPSPW